MRILRSSFCTTKRYRVKPYTIFNNNLCLSITPVRALFKETLGEVRLPKTGAMLLEVVPYQIGSSKQKEYTFLWQKRIFFDANIHNVGILIGLSLDLQREKSVKYEMQTQNTHAGDVTRTKLIIGNDNGDKWTLKMQSTKSQGKTVFNLNPKTLDLQKSQTMDSKADSQTLYYRVHLSRSDILVISELSKFALPYLLGWDVLQQNKTIQSPTDPSKY